MPRPPLPSSVDVRLPDVERAWERFEMFEALHSRMRICNPLSSGQLNQLIEAIDPQPGETALDVACGHGELLIRLARKGVRGLGVDISPWALVRAHDSAVAAGVVDGVAWHLDDGINADPGPFDIVSCIGSSWVFDGVGGTIEALTERLRPGGRLVLGELTTRHGTGPSTLVTEAFGDVNTPEGITALLEAAGLTVVLALPTGRRSWDDYQDQIQASAVAYHQDNPGPAASEYLEDAKAWRRTHAAAIDEIDWVAYVAARP